MTVQLRWFAVAAASAAALAAPCAAAQAPDGCWVHAFARTQFRPPVTTYTGPSHERQFMKEARSIIVGPRARVVGYGAARYEKQALGLGPGTRVANLGAIDFHRRVDAFQVLCTDG